MTRTGPIQILVATAVSAFISSHYIWSAFWNVIHLYPHWYSTIFPDASLYYVGLVILSMFSVLVSGISFITIVGILGFFLKDIFG